MVGRTKAIGKKDRVRFAALQRIGCICCWMEGHPYIPADMHHITWAGRRQGHEATLPLCPWHHRAVPPFGYGPQTARAVLGPSLAESKRAFIARYGTEEDLLERVNQMVEEGHDGEVFA